MAERRIESLQHNGDSYTFNDPTKLDKSEYSGFPSSVSIALAWPATGTTAGGTIIAPDDGWVVCARTTTGVSGIRGYVALGMNGINNIEHATDPNATVVTIIPVRKNTGVYVHWANAATAQFLNFVPALRAV